MNFEIGFKTDIGLKRTQNQDQLLVLPECGLFVVADGMGGHLGGEIASKMAVTEISTFVQQAITQPEWNPQQVLEGAISAANRAIYEKSQIDPHLRGMGTTTTALLFQKRNETLLLTVGQVGDSRSYLIQPAALWQLTRDHSLVQEKVRAGILKRDEAKKDQMKNVLTRSVGFEPAVEVETFQLKTNPGDCFLMCSDGLHGPVDAPSLLQLFEKRTETGDTLQKIADQMILAANTRGGDDNITCILIQVK